jgi:hypothetical protein
VEKSKSDQHAYEERHKVGCDEARILEIESNSRYRKYKESAHMACLTNPISQLSLDISPVLISFIRDKNSYDVTHGAEAFLRSCQLCSHSRNSQHFMEPEGFHGFL